MKRKIFILHEIYGVNDFIKMQAEAYSNANTTVECISLYLDNRIFPYEQEQQAYTYFINEIGFDAPLEQLTEKILEARSYYDEVLLIGFSVGATLAWRLSTLPLQGIVCVYGSRIRQYLDVIPSCPTLVILPSHEKSFNVHELKEALDILPSVHTKQYLGRHGFMDCNNSNYCYESYLQAQAEISQFFEIKHPGGLHDGPK
ncbi:dienelactone hydrolase family protein [Lysinibacillus xylanilyticus]|uniref:dienelactone hydrolase family protein n=1 Tax=Lysinibacillus xylanilyticus TaxID=582475 RepID=UPI002B24EE52|nr:dienelactone hydrolase family protein [Lysinibacillus xylanilyticus]MEB2302086.1 dienelactone hydrolase family protein [Lysinibacillus xylanilyticus]